MLFSAHHRAENMQTPLPLDTFHRRGGPLDYRMQRAGGGEDPVCGRVSDHHRQGHFAISPREVRGPRL